MLVGLDFDNTLAHYDNVFAAEAKKFGLIDNVIGIDNNPTITEMMKGFDSYYKKEVMKRNS